LERIKDDDPFWVSIHPQDPDLFQQPYLESPPAGDAIGVTLGGTESEEGFFDMAPRFGHEFMEFGQQDVHLPEEELKYQGILGEDVTEQGLADFYTPGQVEDYQP